MGRLSKFKIAKAPIASYRAHKWYVRGMVGGNERETQETWHALTDYGKNQEVVFENC